MMKPRLLAFLAVGFLSLASILALMSGLGTDKQKARRLADSGQGALIYAVHFDLGERDERGTLSRFSVKGHLAKSVQADGSFRSEWKDIDALTVNGLQVDLQKRLELLDKPIVSILNQETLSYEHFFSHAFASDHIGVQVKLLNKMLPLLLQKDLRARDFERQESDELGSYRANYIVTVGEKGFLVDKTWMQYALPGLKVDASEHTIHYDLSEDGSIRSAQGQLTLHDHASVKPSHTSLHFEMTLESRAQIAEKDRLDIKNMRQADDAQQRTLSDAERAENKTAFQSALKALDSINAASKEDEVFKIFNALKSALQKDPDLSQALFATIATSESRDDDTKRRLRVVFGVLAQSSGETVPDQLSAVASDCPDAFCKMQAIVALSDHPYPHATNLQKLIAISENDALPLVADTALLSAGTMARRLGSDNKELDAIFSDNLNDPKKMTRRASTIAAMGNRGSLKDLARLEHMARDELNVMLQSSALYSLRYMPKDSVNLTLLDALAQTQDKHVVLEIFKTLAYRNLTETQYRDFAINAAALRDLETASSAMSLLVSAYQDNAQLEKSLLILRDHTSFKPIREALNAEVGASKRSN